MSDLNFRAIQQAFTDAIRSEDQSDFQGIEARRLAVYRELFFNNVEGFISGTFPVLKECLDENLWQKMVREFFIKHECETPYFLEISEEFLAFLQSEGASSLNLPDFTYSLAHWEWMELFADAYEAQTEVSVEAIQLDSDILTSIETAWLQAYEYPVHQITPEESVEQQATFLLVYRKNETVNFIELNPLSYLLFQALQNNSNQTITEIVKELSATNGLSFDQLINGAMEIIAHWSDLQLIKKIHQ